MWLCVPRGLQSLLLVVLVSARAPPVAPTYASQNLNGARYGVANAPELGRNFSLLSRASRFVDVYTPVISSLYSQVRCALP